MRNALRESLRWPRSCWCRHRRRAARRSRGCRRWEVCPRRFRRVGRSASRGKRRRARASARLTVTLRSSARNVTLRSAKARAQLLAKVTVARETRRGTYTLRACVRRGATKASCKSERLRVTAKPSTPAPPAAAPQPAPALRSPPRHPRPPPRRPRRTACAPPLTGENFYFVMADRFKNANAGQRQGRHRLRRPRRPRLRPDEEGLLPRR